MKNHLGSSRRYGAAALALSLTAAALLLSGGTANAAIVPTIPLGTSANYSVLAGQTVTNTGPTLVNKSLGVLPGSAVTGFPPGTIQGTHIVTVTDKNNLTNAYLEAQARTNNAVPADLTGLTLQGGVFAVASRGAMELSGTLTLDGASDPNSVFIFQTNSSLTIGPGSTVSLINGASPCNVFWQVGSSATLDDGATFVGNILALTSISLNDSVTVEGRALAQNGSVTLINDTFTTPTCAGETVATPPPTTPATTPGGGGGAATPADSGGGTATGLTNGVPGVSGPPRTGGAPLQSGGSIPWLPAIFAVIVIGAGTTDLLLSRRAHARRAAVVDPTDPSRS